MARTSRSHDALQQLLEERTRYEQWMATLESKRDTTPEHVYKRVHGDYEQRLVAVRSQLTERTGEIRSAIAGLKERLARATEQETQRVDELHEAELRSLVGEFTPEQWELRKREVEVDLKRFGDEKKKIAEELNELLLIMEQTTDQELGEHESAPDTSDAKPAAEPAPAPAAQSAPADATRVRSKTPARSRAALDAPPAAEEQPPVPIETLAPADGLPATEPAHAAEPEIAKIHGGTEAAPPAATEPELATQGHRGKSAPHSHTAADPRRESEKTLKCGECGALNYPTEWYCESCGGELSAL